MLRYLLITILILPSALMPKMHLTAQDDGGWGDGCDEKAIALIAESITVVDYVRACDDFRLCLYSTNLNLSCRMDAAHVFMETCATVKCERYALLLAATLSFFGDSTVDGPDDQPPQIVIDFVPEILNAYQQDDYRSALSKLQAIAEENGLGFEAMLHLSQGIVHEQLDAPGNALTAYDRALQTAPGDALILYTRTKLLGALGRREETAFEARRLSQYFQLSPSLQTLIIPLQEQYTLQPGQSENWLLYPIISAGFGPGGDHFFAVDHLPPSPVGLTPYPPTDGLIISGMNANSPENELELEMMFFSREGQELVFYWPKGFDGGGTIRLYAVSADHDIFFAQSSRLFYEAYSIEHFLLVREGAPDPRVDLIGTRCGVISRLRPNVEIAAHSFDPDGEPIFDMPNGQKIGAATSFTVLNDHECVDNSTWWWNVQSSEGVTGWIRENDAKQYLVNPRSGSEQWLHYCRRISTSRLTTVSRGMVITGFGHNNLRNAPTIHAEVINQIPEGETVDLVAGPVCADGYVWWQIDYNGVTGWTAEGEGDTYWLEPIYEDDAVTD